MQQADPLADWVAARHPGATITGRRRLRGGISTLSTAFQVIPTEGPAIAAVYRIHEPGDAERVRREFRTLQILHEAGMPVPEPLGMNLSDDKTPALVIRFLEGAPDLHPSDLTSYLRQYAQILARIHGLTAQMPHLVKDNSAPYRAPRTTPNEELRESEIYAALEAWGPVEETKVISHGDLWPGNVIWQEDQLIGVIDWEEACFADPVADLSICRLDVAWAFGFEAATTFTECYVEATGVSTVNLPYWDLVSALRPITNLDEWAPAYPSLGRPDVTYEHMAEVHQRFVGQALVCAQRR